MTYQKINEVLANYHLVLMELDTLNDPQLFHLVEMIPQVREFLADNRIDKATRWLGFIQGVFYCKGIYTIEEMSDHNKPDDIPLDQPVIVDQSAEILTAFAANPRIDKGLAKAMRDGADALREKRRIEEADAAKQAEEEPVKEEGG